MYVPGTSGVPVCTCVPSYPPTTCMYMYITTCMYMYMCSFLPTHVHVHVKVTVILATATFPSAICIIPFNRKVTDVSRTNVSRDKVVKTFRGVS